MNRYRLWASLGVLFYVALVYQNCGRGFQAQRAVTDLSSHGNGTQSSPPDTDETPAGTDEEEPPEVANEVPVEPMPTATPTANLAVSKYQANLLSDCMTNPNYNTCLFWKNPVAQNGAPLGLPVTVTSALGPLQIHAANIEGAGVNGELSNTSFRVRAFRNEVLESCVLPAPGFKVSFQADPVCFSQVFGFYWLQLQESFMNENAGGFYASGRAIDAITYTPGLQNAYWDSITKRMTIGEMSFAVSGEVYTHEMGHANLDYATNSQINQIQNVNNIVACDVGTCCATSNGCSLAINEGQADYHMGLLFPDKTAFLESFVNRVEGIAECRLNRALDANVNTSAQQAYQACTTVPGEVHLQGRIYASVWWEVRKRVILQMGQAEVKNLDALFTEHLTVLAAADDFISALAKIRSVDQALFQAKFGALFTAEFARRRVQ